jgi:ADP-ribose pyrophosphatase YjhB (NUDIX family)
MSPEIPEEFRFTTRVPDGDNRPRRVCEDCGYVAYVNPKIVAGAVCTLEDRVLLCRRAIEPRRGFWTIPAGYMETGETVEECVRREAMEEAGARIEPRALLGIYNVREISQVHLLYKARLLSPDVEAGEESLEVRLFRWEDVPWEELSFPSVEWALRLHAEVRDTDRFPPFRFPEDGRP